jgi:hypothetical protein
MIGTMIETAARFTVMAFGFFFLVAGAIMLFLPQRARMIVSKAGSTNFINYAEITLRMLPAAALILAGNVSKYPEIFRIFGWFMLCTSFVLYFVPRKIHHNFSLKASNFLLPHYFQIISPFAFAIGCFIIYCVI